MRELEDVHFTLLFCEVIPLLLFLATVTTQKHKEFAAMLTKAAVSSYVSGYNDKIDKHEYSPNDLVTLICFMN